MEGHNTNIFGVNLLPTEYELLLGETRDHDPETLALVVREGDEQKSKDREITVTIRDRRPGRVFRDRYKKTNKQKKV